MFLSTLQLIHFQNFIHSLDLLIHLIIIGNHHCLRVFNIQCQGIGNYSCAHFHNFTRVILQCHCVNCYQFIDYCRLRGSRNNWNFNKKKNDPKTLVLICSMSTIQDSYSFNVFPNLMYSQLKVCAERWDWLT